MYSKNLNRAKSFAFTTLMCFSLEVMAAGQATFTALGDLSGDVFGSVAADLSADGNVVVGNANAEFPNGGDAPLDAFRWENGTMMSLGQLPGGVDLNQALGVSADGRIAVGSSVLVGETQAFRWEAGEISGLGYLFPDHPHSIATAVSANGDVIVGSAWNESNMGQAVTWIDGQISSIPFVIPGRSSNAAIDVTSDGRTIVGWGRAGSGSNVQVQAWHSRDGMTQAIGAWFPSGVSNDGRVIVGRDQSSNAVRWIDGDMEILGDLGVPDSFRNRASAASRDGYFIVGVAENLEGESEAFIWDPVNGMRAIASMLQQETGIELGDWKLEGATGISDDGTKLIGWGRNPQGELEGWLLDLGQIVFVDFTNPTTSGFALKTHSFLGRSWPIPTGVQGESPPLPDDLFRGLVLNSVRAAFSTAGAPIPVWEYIGDPRDDNALYVRFHGSLGEYTSELNCGLRKDTTRLFGIAYNISLSGARVIDQFNERLGGEVAIFNEEELTTNPDRMAAVIAHEVGHGLGLRHVNPFENNPIEVMDYASDPLSLESFSNSATDIVEPPVDPTQAGIPEVCIIHDELTHNPTYHLRHSLKGVESDVLAAEGVLPGEWDLDKASLMRIRLETVNVQDGLFDVAAFARSGISLGNFEDDLSFAARFANVDSLPLEWVINAADSFAVYASSSDSLQDWNAFFSIADGSKDISLAEGPFSGQIFAVLPGTTELVEVGTFTGEASLVSPSVPPSVPACAIRTDYEDASCFGTLEVYSLADYLDYTSQDFGRAGGSRYQNLKIMADLDSTTLNITSPCKITLSHDVTLTGDFVNLDGRRGVAGDVGYNINAAGRACVSSEEGNAGIGAGSVVLADHLSIMSPKIAKIGLNSQVTVSGTLEVRSTGSFSSSTAVIQSGAIISADSLSVKAVRRAHVGLNSEVSAGQVELISTGQLSASDAGLQSGAMVFADQLTISASSDADIGLNATVDVSGNLNIVSTGTTNGSRATVNSGADISVGGDMSLSSGNKASIGNSTSVTVSGDLHMDAIGNCTIGATAVLMSGSQSGNCLE